MKKKRDKGNFIGTRNGKRYYDVSDFLHVCLDGSPRNCGFKTQQEFIDRISHYEAEDLTFKEVGLGICEVLITDNEKSSSRKVKWMRETWGKEADERIMTYDGVLELFSEHFRRDKVLKLMNKIKGS
jgi:hypothetical protein